MSNYKVAASFGVAVYLIGIGATIGGWLVQRMYRKSENRGAEAWKHTAMIFKDFALSEAKKNDELKKKLKEEA